MYVQAEFAAEQEYLQTLSYLGPEEEKRYRERQGVQFMYMKPPGAGEDPLVKTQVCLARRSQTFASQLVGQPAE